MTPRPRSGRASRSGAATPSGGRPKQSEDLHQYAGERGSAVADVRAPAVVNDGAGFLLGLVLYALALNYLQGGTPQVKGWLGAKFVNKPWRAPKARTTGAPARSTGSGAGGTKV